MGSIRIHGIFLFDLSIQGRYRYRLDEHRSFNFPP